MEARELRVNNLIDYNGFTARVLSINAYSNPSVKIQFTSSDEFIYIQEESLNYQPIVKPIPLTEEWLIKFGFEYKNNSSSGSALHKNGVYLGVLSECFCFNAESSTNKSARLKYAHQLQNLYFALTGEELTIKE